MAPRKPKEQSLHYGLLNDIDKMIKTMPICCVVWNKDATILDCNQEAIDLFGISSKQEYIDNFQNLSPQYQQDGSLSTKAYSEMIHQALIQKNISFAWMHQTIKGTLIPCKITMVCIGEEDQTSVIAYTHDVRESLEVLSKARETEECARVILDASPLCYNFWDKDYNIIDCNQEAMHLFSLKSKQEYLKRFYDLSPEYQPDGRCSKEMTHEKLYLAYTSGHLVFEWMHQNLDGEDIPCEITLERVEREDGYYIAAYTRDLRESKAIFQKMQEAEERTRIMLDATPLCCNFWDADFNNIDCNQEAVNLFALRDKQEYLQRFNELSPVHQPDGVLSSEKAQEKIKEAFAVGEIRFEWMHQKLNGELIPCEITLIRVEYGKGYTVLGYTRDLRESKAILAQIDEANERTRIMLDATPLCCNFWDADYNNIDCNQEAVNLFELDNKQEYLDRFMELSPQKQPDGTLSSEKSLMMIQEAFAKGRTRFEWMHQKLDGEQIPCEITLVCVERDGGHIVLGYTQDMRESKAILAKMHEADERSRIMLDATPLCCNLWDENLNNIDCNLEAVNLFELKNKQEYLDRFNELSPERQPDGSLSSEKAFEKIQQAFSLGRIRFEWMHQKLDGQLVPSEITLVRVARGDGYIVAGYTRDLRELKETVSMLDQLEVLAFTDSLTSIYNRRYFMDNARQEFTRAEYLDTPVSIIFYDLDLFKNVNDTYGHIIGDEILKAVTARVKGVLRAKDILARYGGEEFLILVSDANEEYAYKLAQRIREQVAVKSFQILGYDIPVTLSMGVAERTIAAQTIEKVIQRADDATYHAKRSGRNRVERHSKI